MHTTSEKIRQQLGIAEAPIRWEDAFVFEGTTGAHVKKGAAIFPRMDVEKELEALKEMQERQAQEAQQAEQEAKQSAAPSAQADGEPAAENSENEGEAPEIPYKAPIDYEDFAKIDFRVGKVLSCQRHPKADKLLVFQIKIGSDVRQIISGVAEFFTPEECVGKKVLVVANLKPRKLRGLESNGMLMFADNGGRFEFMTTIARDGEIVS